MDLFIQVNAALHKFLAVQFGLTDNQYEVLRTLSDRGGEATVGELVTVLGRRSYSSTTDIVDRLERAGWVKRSYSADDRRCVIVTLERWKHFAEVEKTLRELTADAPPEVLTYLQGLIYRLSEVA